MIKFFTISLLFLFSISYSGWSQNAQTAGKLVGVLTEKQACLSPAEHDQIQEMLKTKLALLKKVNQRARQTAHPKFIFPLKWAKPTAPFGFWTIVNYVDLNPSIGPNEVNQFSSSNLDYNCGNRTYDQKSGYQHQGTDISLWPFDWTVMQIEGVKVVAAAAGTIISKSDGNDDQSCGSFATASSDWNAVYIRHDDGSVAWYGHLKKNTLTPKTTGQRVEAGETIGFVGSSGRSSGPHLHFEVYSADNKLIDPFEGPCNKTSTDSWWQDQPVYKEKSLSRLSIHTTQPVMGVCPASANVTNEIVAAKPGQRFYFYAFGRELETSDAIQFQLFQPNGQLFTTYQDKGTSSYATFYWYMYTTIPEAAPIGQWKLRVTFGGKSYEKPFWVTPNLDDVLKITSSGSLCQDGAVKLATNIESDEVIWKYNGTVFDRVSGGQISVRNAGRYTAEINGVTSNTVNVTEAALPTISISGSTTINVGLETGLKLAFTGTAPYRYKLSNGISGTCFADTTLLVSPDKTTIYEVLEVADKCGVGSVNSSAKATITVTTPTIQTLPLSNSTVCSGNRLVVDFRTTGVFNSGNLFKVHLAKTETDSSKITFTDLTTIQTASNQLTSIITEAVTSGSYWIRVMATNPKIPINGTVSPTRLTILAPPTATLSGSKSIYEGESATLTVRFTGDSPWTFSYRDSSAVAVTSKTVSTSANPYELVVKPLKTTAYFLTSVSNGCGVNNRISDVTTVSVSPLLATQEELAETIEVYPVPATNLLNIQLNYLPAGETALLTLSTLGGQIVSKHEAKQKHTVLKLDHYPAGLYTLYVQIGDRATSKKIIKQ
ncbi:hypothetical protein GCM10028807_02100 [Spirosoma daeguense]